MGLIEMEIAGQDWTGMLCGCGSSAEHVALDLLRLAGRGPLGEPSHVSLEDHVWSPAVLWEPAPAVTSVTLAALADEVAPTVRTSFLDLLQRMVAGEGTDWESARRGLDLPELCQNLAAQGLWLLYEEVMSNRSLPAAGTAFEILTVVEPDRARLQRVREIAADWLPVCCRTGLCDDHLRGRIPDR
ncbi:hypothetical protein GA0115240_142141 [Streptomyces sp. DvalAA-14]|uniref:hypothetical protein n=1 Tax=unclassified Streptomyces TaxID=2593676 RepID=UPI00081B6126|nr:MULTISPECIES: hypothetical protein [unclassified Streptomyces]MYS22488.1 hypothetical protein [Streptomyces sp. SID4948]SCE17159.1 hypothetical protein GA0115240_142141 [Streptomyces sp. DvalAA-14]